MKTALYVGGAAVGLVLLWKYVLKPTGGAPLTMNVAPAQAITGGFTGFGVSSMTEAGALATSSGGVLAMPGLLRAPPAGGSSPGASGGSIAAMKAGEARLAMAQVLASDAAPAVAAPSPNGFSTTTVGTPGIEGTLSTGDGVDQRLQKSRNSVNGIYN